MSSNERPHRCLCDRIFGVSAEYCDATTSYLCRCASVLDRPSRFQLDGETVDFNTAVAFTANVLKLAQAPAISGVQHLGIAAQQACLNLARSTQAYVSAHANNDNTIWRQGRVTATLGDALDRSELIICIHFDLKKNHPRIHQLIESKGILIKHIAADQESDFDSLDLLGVCDEKQLSDLFGYAELLIRGVPLTQSHRVPTDNQQRAKHLAAQLADTMKSNQCVTFLTDLECSGQCRGNSHHDQLASLAKSAHALAKCYVLDLGVRCNEQGANHVFTWSTGFPNNVSFLSKNPSSLSIGKASKFDGTLQIEIADSLLTLRSQETDEASYPRIVVQGNACSNDRSEKRLVIEHLSLFPDDFFRFDDVPCEILVEQEQLQQRITVADLLHAVLNRVRAQNQ